MPIYVYKSPSFSPRLRKSRRWVFLCLLLGLCALLGLNSGSDSEEPPKILFEESLSEESDTTSQGKSLALHAEEPIPAEPTEIAGHIQRGETFTEALNREGISHQQIGQLISALRHGLHRSEFNPSVIQNGDQYAIVLDTIGAIERFEYTKRGDHEHRFFAERTNQAIKAWKESFPLVREVVTVSNRIDDSIWNALQTSRASPDLLAGKLEYIFEYDIDFQVDCRAGDRFSIAVEKFYNQNGQFVRYGDVLAAEYKSAKETEIYQAFRFVDPQGNEGYYNATGRSLQGIFLKAPLNFTRISSKFASTRFHTILKKTIPHHGVDYAAPHGTRVWAIADGVVTFAGHKGALGKYVEIKHKNGYKTGYGHLSGFARGLRTGQRIKQKQGIGYVGATGRATGPHLHFNFYTTLNGRYQLINPDRAINRPTGQPVPKAYLANFYQNRDQLLVQLAQHNGNLVTAAIQDTKFLQIEE